MRRLFQAGTGSLYFLPPEYFPLPFGGVTCSFPRLNGAPRPRPLFACFLRWSTSNKRKRTQYTLKRKKNIANITGRDFRTKFSCLSWKYPLCSAFLKDTLHIGNPEKHELLHRYLHIIPIELYKRLSLVYEDQWLANVTNFRISIQKLPRRYSLSLSKKWPRFSWYVIHSEVKPQAFKSRENSSKMFRKITAVIIHSKLFSVSDWLKLYACSS